MSLNREDNSIRRVAEALRIERGRMLVQIHISGAASFRADSYPSSASSTPSPLESL